MKRSTTTALLVTVLLTSAACAGRTAAWDGRSDVPEREVTLLAESALLASEGDMFWANRLEQEPILDALIRWEQAVAIDPEDHETHIRMSRARAYLAMNHIEDEEERVETLDAGLRAAENALMVISPEFGDRMRRGAKFVDVLEILGPEAAGALYWYAVNLEHWLESSSSLVRMRYGDLVETLMRYVLEIGEDYHYAAPHRYFGLRYAEEGDLEAAGQHLQRAAELAPALLTNQLHLAELVALPTGDRELFEARIGKVLVGDESNPPGMVPENRQAKRRARELLAAADSAF